MPWNYDTRSFWIHLFSWSQSVAPRVLGRVAVFSTLGTLVMMLIWRFPKLQLDAGVAEFVGAGLAVLLAFRTNAGYDRWWEGRKLWGGIVNQSRNLVITALGQGPREAEWREEVVALTAAFAHACRCVLTGESGQVELDRLLGHTKSAALSASPRPLPIALGLRLSELLRSARESNKLDPWAYALADGERIKMVDHIGGCERIVSSPLPLVHVINLRHLVAAYLVSLPFALSVTFGWATPVVIAVTAYAFLALDQAAVEMENPFSESHLSHLPLKAICEKIERDVYQLKDALIPAP